MSEKVLITGASGFVGYHLIQAALKNGLEVVAAVRRNSDIEHLRSLPVKFVTLPADDRIALTESLKKGGYPYIVHAAGLTRAKDQEEYDRANAVLTRDLALAAVESGIPLKKFVFISSLAAIGPNSDDLSEIAADRVPHPVTAYGRSKLLAEQYLSQISALPLLTLRPTAVYGPRERDLFLIVKSVARGIEPYIGSGSQQLSFVYVKDLAAVTLQALRSPKADGTAYNISDGKLYSRYAFADHLKAILGKKTLRFNVPLDLIRLAAAVLEAGQRFSGRSPVLNREKLNELTASNWALDIGTARNDLGYAPSYDLEAGLTETLAWYKKNHWLK